MCKKAQAKTWVLFAFVFAWLLPITSFSAVLSAAGVIVSAQPFVGYEKSVKFYPDLHANYRLIYGARFIAGFNSLAGEGEVSRAEDSEIFYDVPKLSDPTVTIKDKTDRLKLGIRRTYSFLGISSFHLRVGGQASRNTHSFTNKGLTTTTVEPVKISPYAGAGIKLSAFGFFAVVADAVVVINDFHDYRRTEVQTTAGISFNL